jgi:hypothetical protein
VSKYFFNLKVSLVFFAFDYNCVKEILENVVTAVNTFMSKVTELLKNNFGFDICLA